MHGQPVRSGLVRLQDTEKSNVSLAEGRDQCGAPTQGIDPINGPKGIM